MTLPPGQYLIDGFRASVGTFGVAGPSGTATGGALIAAQTTDTDAVPTTAGQPVSARVPRGQLV